MMLTKVKGPTTSEMIRRWPPTRGELQVEEEVEENKEEVDEDITAIVAVEVESLLSLSLRQQEQTPGCCL